MLANIVRTVSGPLGVAVTLAELVVLAGKAVESLSDDEEEEEP